MLSLTDHIRLLGLRVKDRVTGFEGVVTSVTYDLYGCIQALVNPGVDKDNKTRDSMWLDTNRLSVVDPTPVMPVPDFGHPAWVDKGPEGKPAYKA